MAHTRGALSREAREILSQAQHPLQSAQLPAWSTRRTVRLLFFLVEKACDMAAAHPKHRLKSSLKPQSPLPGHVTTSGGATLTQRERGDITSQSGTDCQAETDCRTSSTDDAWNILLLFRCSCVLGYVII